MICEEKAKEESLYEVNTEGSGRIEPHLEDQEERMKFGETLEVHYTNRAFALCLRFRKRVRPTSYFCRRKMADKVVYCGLLRQYGIMLKHTHSGATLPGYENLLQS